MSIRSGVDGAPRAGDDPVVAVRRIAELINRLTAAGAHPLPQRDIATLAAATQHLDAVIGQLGRRPGRRS